MVAAKNIIIPILGYSPDGIITDNSPKPENFSSFIKSYKNQIKHANLLKSESIKALCQWDTILNNKFISLKRYSYTQNTSLFNTSRGYVKWGQEWNNNGGCSPCYNEFTPGKSDNNLGCTGLTTDNCYCDNKPVGCAAVAMGQIMWYWQFPPSSSFRDYNWNNMPNAIYNNTSQESADEIAHLLRDCGDASDITFCCAGSWTTTNNIVSALTSHFDYKGVEKKVRTDWSDASWGFLLQAEIDAGRPVLYRGDKADLSGEKHFFVVDGYSLNPTLYHINWGWNGSGYDGYYDIDDLTPDNNDFTENQQAIVGISPTCSEISQNINDLNYSLISSGEFKNEQARNNISIPSSGESLTIESGGELYLTSGNKIILSNGFSAKSGSIFKTNIATMGFDEEGLNVPIWYNGISPNGDGKNDCLCLYVYNADAWDCLVYDLDGSKVFDGAGRVDSDEVCVWDGNGADYQGTYLCIVNFRNSCGERVDNAWMVTVAGNTTYNKSLAFNEDSRRKLTEDSENGLKNDENLFEIIPNPTDGLIFIRLNSENMINKIEIYSTLGIKVYDSKFDGSTTTIDLSDYGCGVYIVRVQNDEGELIKKLIIN
jgi:hypothetical protein